MSARRGRKLPSANVIEILPILYPCGKVRVSLGAIDDNARGRPPLNQHRTTAFQDLSRVASPQTTVVPLSLPTSLRFAV